MRHIVATKTNKITKMVSVLAAAMALSACSSMPEMPKVPEFSATKIVPKEVLTGSRELVMGFQTKELQSWNLVPDSFDIDKATHKLIHITVDSKARDSMFRREPGVPLDELKVALKDSINASGLFRKTEYSREADFDPRVTVLPSKIVKEGKTEVFWSPARWKLTDSRTGEVLFDEQVVKWQKAKVDEMPDNLERNTHLVVGAVKKSIKEGIEQLAALEY
jgi:hypothetical protein